MLEVNKLENIIDINIESAEEDNNHIFLRATSDGKPEYIDQTINGVIHKAIKVGNKIYVLK